MKSGRPIPLTPQASGVVRYSVFGVFGLNSATGFEEKHGLHPPNIKILLIIP
jgi:hypothetical protein